MGSAPHNAPRNICMREREEEEEIVCGGDADVSNSVVYVRLESNGMCTYMDACAEQSINNESQLCTIVVQ